MTKKIKLKYVNTLDFTISFALFSVLMSVLFTNPSIKRSSTSSFDNPRRIRFSSGILFSLINCFFILFILFEIHYIAFPYGMV